MRILKQSTACTITLGPFVDPSDGTAETGLTISQADVRLSKNGGAYAQKNEATACTHQENGNYSCPLDTTDTNTLGHMRVHVNEAGALPVWDDLHVWPANVWDSFFGSDKLQVDAVEISGDDTAANNLEAMLDGTGSVTITTAIVGSITGNLSGSVGSVTGAVGSVTGNVGGNVAGSVGSVSGSVGSVAGDVGGKVLGGGSGTITGTGARAVDGSGNAIATADALSSLADALDDAKGNGFEIGADSLEAISNRLTSVQQSIYLVNGVVGSTVASNAFTSNLTQGDGYWDDALLVFTSGNLIGQSRPIARYLDNQGELQFDEPFTGEPVSGDTFAIRAEHIHPVTQIAAAVVTELDPPANFSDLNITASTGRVTVGTNTDKTGYSLTATTGLGNQTANITGNLSGSVGSVTGNIGGSVAGSVGSVTGNVGGIAGTIQTLDALDTAQDAQHDATQSAIDGLNNLSAAQVNAEVDQALADVGLTTTVTARIDVAISTRLATAGYTSPPSASTISTQVAADLAAAHGAGAWTTADVSGLATSAELDAVDTKLDGMRGATFDAATDSLEAIRNRGDAAWVTGSGGEGDPQAIRDAMQLAPTTPGSGAEGSIDSYLSAIQIRTDLLGTGGVRVVSPVMVHGTEITLYQGVDHTTESGLSLVFQVDGGPSLVGAGVPVLTLTLGGETVQIEGAIEDAGEDVHTVRFQPSAADTAGMAAKDWRFQVRVTLQSGTVYEVSRGKAKVLEDYAAGI